MSYQALYRKWRPDNFNDVKGQDTIVTTLQNQIKANRIGHAYLFCGTRGTGKTSVAKILAKAVNCENPKDGSPCGECPTCKAIASGISMNVIEIDAASNNGVDSVREIIEEVAYSPTEGKYKVYIIDEVHMLSPGAFNALLKTLEEPPSYVIFILATTEIHKIPITILSRCQRYDFRRISIETITDRLAQLMKAEGVTVEDKALKYVAKAADGSMRDALSLLDQCIAFYLGKELKYENVLEVLGAVDTEVFGNCFKAILQGSVSECMSLIDEVIIQGRDLAQFVTDFVWYLRNLLLIQTTDDFEKIEDVIEVSKENLLSLKEDSKLADADTIMRYIRVLSELSNQLKVATQKRVKLEVAFIKLMKPAMDNEQDVEEFRSRINSLESILYKLQNDIKNGNAALSMGTNQGRVSNPEYYQNEEDFDEVNMGLIDDILNQDARSSAVKNASKIKEPIRKIDALPEDIEEIAKGWKNIILSMDDSFIRSILQSAKPTLAEDGKSLEIMVQSMSSFNILKREDNKKYIVDTIEERTGFAIDVIITHISDSDEFHNGYVDLQNIVNIEIGIDDEEDLI